MNYHSDHWIMDMVQEHYMDWINKYLYNPKQLHHLLRVEEYIERYINGESYEKCLQSKMPDFLKQVKLGASFDLDAARVVDKKSIEHIDEMCDEFLKGEWSIDETINTLLDDVQYEIMRIAIKKEIGE